METIKHLKVTVTYEASYKNIEVSKGTLKKLESIRDKGYWSPNSYFSDIEMGEWLINNVRESDAFDCQYEIDILDI